MTDFSLTELLELQSEDEQRRWLADNVPARDDRLIAALEAELQFRFRNDPQTAVPLLRLLSDTAALWSDEEIAADRFYWEACTLHFLAKHREALQFFSAASSAYQDQGLPNKVARTAVGQLNAMLYLGMYDEGLQVAGQIVPVLQENGDRMTLAKLYMNRANLQIRRGQFQEALASYIDARDIFLAENDPAYASIAQMNIANVQMTLDDFLEAERNYQEARAAFEAQGMSNMLAITVQNLGELAFYQGQYQHALQMFDNARQIFVAQDNPVDVAYVDLFRSDVYLALNLWTEAVELAASARQAFQDAEMNWEAGRLWLHEAAALAHLDDGRSAEPALLNARAIFTAEANELWLAFTDLYEAVFAKQQGNYELADTRARQAAEVFRRMGLRGRAAQGLAVAGQAALLANRTDVATDMFTQALSELRETNNPGVLYACYDGLGQIAEQAGEHEQARDFYRLAIQTIESLQATISAEDYKIAFLGDKLRIYEAHILLCLQAGSEDDLHEAFATVEKAKSRALLDLLVQEIRSNPETAGDAELISELDRLRRELNWYYNLLNGNQSDNHERSIQQLREWSEIVRGRENDLRRLLNHMRQRDVVSLPLAPVWTVSLEQLQASLPENSLVLEFFTTKNNIVVFGVTATTSWSAQIEVSLETISNLLGQLRFQMNKFVYGSTYRTRNADTMLLSVNDVLRQIYRQLIGPIARRLTERNLIVVPHALLHYVPFHALLDGDDYLLDSYSISYAPSATILHRLLIQPDQRTLESPLIMGVSDESIPFAQTEAESISDLFDDARLFVGSQATIGTLSAHLPQSGLLHLSTHATFRYDNPMFSALKLADGWLSVNDIYQIADLPPLVTLSACETGSYEVAKGDEIFGLSRGLLASGARSIVVSLWSVDDEVTADLMRHFYGALQQGEDVHEALRLAQLAIKSQHPHPYFWSPFVVIGDRRNPIQPGGVYHLKEKIHHASPSTANYN